MFKVIQAILIKNQSCFLKSYYNKFPLKLTDWIKFELHLVVDSTTKKTEN